MKTMIGCGKAALLFGGTLILDQAVKAYVASTMLPGESIPVIPSYLHLTYVLNAGAAFGIFERQQWLFLLTAALFFLVFLFLSTASRARQRTHSLRQRRLCGRSTQQHGGSDSPRTRHRLH